jgi:hypothetical protein
MNEAEKAIARACLSDVDSNLEQLRALPEWWASLPDFARSEFKQFHALVLMKLHWLE